MIAAAVLVGRGHTTALELAELVEPDPDCAEAWLDDPPHAPASSVTAARMAAKVSGREKRRDTKLT